MASILIPLAEGFEELEAVTLIDLFQRARFELCIARLGENPVTGARGTRILADHSLEDIVDRNFDMVVLPGGQPGTNNLNKSTLIHKILKQQNERKAYIAAICAAPLVLANTGLLTGKRATSFPGAIDLKKFSNIDYTDEDVVQDGRIITSKGPGTAMDFALFLIELAGGKSLRNEVEAPLQRPQPA